jgi:hypothetical protein
MKALAFCLCCLMITVAAFAVSGPPQPVSHAVPAGGALDQTWGPDAYGYRARDNNEPNGPTFAWLDISTTGTQVTGLGDDNTSLVYPIGFTFHYYWYDVTQFWVGSNGYIQFHPGGLLAQAFPSFPNAALPNDVLGCYVADWILGGSEPGHCYYETRGGDSLIVMWKNVRAWGANGNLGDHNFEIILCRHDSSFTYQIGQCTTGDVSNSDIKVGMENVSGSVGMQLFSGAYPPNNTAIKFYYPPAVTYVAHDMGIESSQTRNNGGFFLVTGDTLFPYLKVTDVGNQTETGFHSIYSVRRTNNVLQMSADSLISATLNPAQALELFYPTTWVAPAAAVFRITGRVNLTTDVNHTNDSVRVQLHTLALPGELYYDDNSGEQGWSWQGGSGGMGNQFVSPVYPCRISQLRFYIYSTTGGTGMTAKIYNDAGGVPGTEVFSQAMSTLVGADWNTLTVNPPVVIDSGAFYVAWMQADSLTTFGVDTNATEGSSRRGWEYSGSWAEFRYGQLQNPMIRCTVDGISTVNHPPAITAHTPTGLTVNAYRDSTVHFAVTAMDSDGDSLSFRWTRDGTQVGTSFASDIVFPTVGTSIVRCVVSDGQAADSVTWTVTVSLISAAGDLPEALPSVFALKAAYPNPFNPSTSLAYDVARDGQISLKVFDLLGNEVTTLAEGYQSAGRYRVTWNAAALPSGMYFAVLQAQNVRQIQKLMLMK